VDAKISAVRPFNWAAACNSSRNESPSTPPPKKPTGGRQIKVDQLRGQFNLKNQVDQLNVRPGSMACLQQLPTPVEVGQKVAPHPLGKVAQASKLKAELKIAENTSKRRRIGQHADIDTLMVI